MSDEPQPNPLMEFLRDLADMIDRHKAAGIRCRLAIRNSLIREEPVLDPATGLRWLSQRPGPVVEVELTAEDSARADEMLLAYYPVLPMTPR